MRPLPLAAALACCAAAALPAAASAATLTYVKDGNVFVANPDGSAPYQVTLDGTAADPYGSPAAADDGTIVATKGPDVVRLSQGGNRLGAFTPPILTDSSGGTAAGLPSQLDVSPDGTRIAYMRASLNCSPTIECRARATVGVVDASGSLVPGQPGLYGEHPAFLDDGRLIYHGGFDRENVVWRMAPGAEHNNWFGDFEKDLTDGRLSADGRRFIQTRGSGDATSIIWYDASDGVGPAVPPRPLCETGAGPGLGEPAIDGTGQTVWWTEPDGVWTKTAADTCTDPQPRLLVPGAKEADWGPAPLAPDTRKGAQQGPAPGGPGTPSPQPTPAPKPSTPGSPATAKPKLAKVRRGKRAVTFRVTCPSRCAFTASLVQGKRTVAKTKGTAKAGKATAVKLRHRGKRGLKLRVRAGGRTVTVEVPR